MNIDASQKAHYDAVINAERQTFNEKKDIERTIKLRGWASQRQISRIIVPARWEVKKLFKMRTKK